MTRFIRFVKGVATSGTLAILGIICFKKSKNLANATWTTNFEPRIRWDHNWDRCDAESLIEPVKPNATQKDVEARQKIIRERTPTAMRYIILIRHGQTEGSEESQRTLTKLGREQVEYTGRRLKEMGLNYDRIISSTMKRAIETTEIIQNFLPGIPVEEDSNLCEGVPVPAEPPVGRWKPEQLFYEDGPRIEAAYRKYFHRAPPDQATDTSDILVCHSIVIRYFVCRALQIPTEAWLRFGLNHASITWFVIRPTGRVLLLQYGDSGHIPVDKITNVDIRTSPICSLNG